MITKDVIPPKKAQVQTWSSAVQDYKYAVAYYNNWIPQDYSSVLTEGEAYDLLKNDGKIRESLNLLSLFASGEKTRLITSKYLDSKAISIYLRIAEKALSNINRFNHGKKAVVFNSHLFGLSLQEVEWETKRIPGLPGIWQLPKSIKEYDKRLLRLERSTEDRSIKYWTMWREETDAYMVLLDRNDYPHYLGPCMQDFLWCYYEQDMYEPYYRGLSHVLFKYAYTKKFMEQYWHELAESWSKPWIQVAADLEKGSFNDGELGEGFETWNVRREEYIRELSKHRARHILVTDRASEDITIHSGGGSIGQNIMAEYVEYANKTIHRNVLGDDLETQEGGSSFNMGTLKRENIDAIVVDARVAAEETHSNQLLIETYWRNRENLWFLGVDVPDRGDVRTEYYIESEEVKKEYLSEGLSEDRKQRSRANV